MDSTVFVPREFHFFLRELGKREWISYGITRDREDGKHQTDISIRWDIINDLLSRQPRPMQPIISVFLRTYLNRGDGYVIDLLSKMFAGGPKLFEPTLHQAEAMLNCSVNLKLNEYQQPFPVTIIKMPQEMVNRGEVDPYVAVYHDTKHNTLSVLCDNIIRGDEAGSIHSSFVANQSKDISEILKTVALDEKNGLDTNNWDKKTRSQQVAINCCLLLTYYQTRIAPLDPDYFAKLKKAAKSSDAAKRERANNFLIGQFDRITFEQEISFYDDEEQARYESNPTGATVGPHWRKGHWRRQAHGPAFGLRKIRFIRPIFVRRDLFKGDIADTSVTYHGKRKA